MSNIKKILEKIDQLSDSKQKSIGSKFPGYWKGTDPASKAKDKMVGSAEESIIKDLHSAAKKKVTEWQLQEKYAKFKEQDSKVYTGIDPIVRQRMGMPPATGDEIRSYVDKNPPAIKAGDGFLKGQHPNDVWNEPKPRMDVLSGGQMDVVNAAIKAAGIKPVSSMDITDFPTIRSTAASAAQTQQPAAPSSSVSTSTSSAATTPAAPAAVDTSVAPPAAAPAAVTTPVAPRNNTSAAALPTASAAVAAQPVVPAPVRAPYRGSSSAREIQAVNPSIRDVNKIQAGQRLKLPDSDKDYVVQKGDTLDKIGKMYRSGEIGGRVVGGDGPTSTPAARTQPAAPTSTSTATPAPSTASSSTAPSTSAASRPRRRPSPEAPRAVPPTSFDPPGPDTDTSDRPAPAARPQPAAPATPRTTHPSGTRVTAQIRDPRDPSKPLSIQLKKSDDGWYDDRGRKINFNKSGDLEKLEQLPADAPTFTDKMKRVLRGELPSKVFGQPKPPQNQTAPATQPPARPATQPAAPKSNSSSSKTDQSGMASYTTKGGRVYAADFNNPSGIGWDGKGKYTSYKTPEEGVNATRNLVTRYLTDQTPYIKGPATPEQVVSTWVTGGKTPADKIQGGRYLQSVKNELAAAGVKLDDKGRIPYSQAATDAITRAIVRHETSPKHMEKFAPFLNAPKNAKGSIEESNKEDEKIAGRYDPDDFDLMVKRLGQRAQEQERKHGPVDIARLAKRLKDIERREQTKEQEDPAINTQDPDIQKTSQTSPQQNPSAVRQQQLDQQINLATAKGTVSGLKNVLGPDVDTNALSSAVTKISAQKPLTGPESTAMSALTPLISKAAETPQTAMNLKTVLSNAGMLTRQGK